MKPRSSASLLRSCLHVRQNYRNETLGTRMKVIKVDQICSELFYLDISSKTARISPNVINQTKFTSLFSKEAKPHRAEGDTVYAAKRLIVIVRNILLWSSMILIG